MAFSKITPQDLKGTGAMSLPDQPTISAQELKRKFDEPAKEVVVPKFNNLIDEIEDSTAAVSLGAAAPTGRTVAANTVQAGLNKLSDDLATVEASISTVVAHDHTHDNKEVLDKLDVSSGSLTYDGVKVGEKDYDNLDNRPQINSHTLTGNQSASDLGLMPATTLATVATSGSYNDLSDKPSIPTVTDTYDGTSSDAMSGKAVESAISTKSTVGWNQIITTGQKIATVSIDGTPTDVYAPTGGGGGGGGAVDSVNGQTGTVVLDLDDINDTSIASLADQDTLVYNGTAGTWGNEPLADVALTGAYSSLTGQPTIPDGLADLTDDVAISSPSSGQILQHNGTKWANANMPSIPDGLADLTDDVSITSPSNDQVLKYDGTSSKWVNGSAPASGHTMIDNSDLLNEMATALTEGTTNDDVVSAYGVGKWSNVDRVTIWTTIAQNNDTIGAWNDNWKEEVTPDRTGWIYHTYLAGILSTNDVDLNIVFDPKEDEVVTLAGWRIDDNYTYNGVTVGCIAIKLNSPVKSANGVKIGVVLDFKRTEVIPATTI